MSTTLTGRRSVPAAVVGLAVAVVLMALAMLVPALTGWNVRVNDFPPLHAEWDPRVGWGTVPALVLAGLGLRHATALSERLTWRRLLLVVFVVGLLWMLSLALVDGLHGIDSVLGEKYEYLRTARRNQDLGSLMKLFTEYPARIPYAAKPFNLSVHVAGHPAGALFFFWVLVKVGLGSGLAAGLAVTVVAASTAVGVLVTLRALGAETMARRVAPLLTLGPAAIWQAVSGDAMFAAFAAWGIACLAIAATRRSIPWSLLAGALLGYCVMLSYGLPLLGVLAIAVLVVARSWLPLGFAVVAAVAVVGAFYALGFHYLEVLPAIHTRYYEGVGGRRPWAYWMWGDLAAFAFSAGPLAFAGAAELFARGRGSLAEPATRVVLWLAGAGVAMALLADLSQMSRAEVERIWLPFAPWLLVACALLPERWRVRGLALQVALALVVQHLLATGW
ncbi:glycosyltransferase family 39 protein [soil metagenome]